MSEESIQRRLREISAAFAILGSVGPKVGDLRQSAERLVRGADQACQRTDRILAGSAQGVDRKVRENLRTTAENGKVFKSRLDDVEMQIAMRKTSLDDEREQLHEQLRAIREAQAAARR